MVRTTSLLAVGISLVGATVAADVPTAAERARGALGQDDACADSGDGACALQALQHRSSKGSQTPEATSAEEKLTPENAPEGWVWSSEDVKKQYVVPLDRPDWLMNSYATPFSVLVSWYCSRWLAYSWAKVAFWSQEVLRRTEALPATPSPSQQEDLQKFARKATFLTCMDSFDAQKGSDWSSHVAEYMRTVAKMPSTSFEMPLLDGWFTESYASYELFSLDACMFWVTSNIYDMAYLARDLKGNKDYGDGICWDKVDRNMYNLTMGNFSLDIPFTIDPFEDNAMMDERDEYLECQEKPLTREVLEANCPMFGHYPEGMWGLGGMFWSWGEIPSADSERYRVVMESNKKLGLPEFAQLDYVYLLPYADHVNLTETPEWKQNATLQMKEKVTGQLKDSYWQAMAMANNASQQLQALAASINATAAPTAN